MRRVCSTVFGGSSPNSSIVSSTSAITPCIGNAQLVPVSSGRVSPRVDHGSGDAQLLEAPDHRLRGRVGDGVCRSKQLDVLWRFIQRHCEAGLGLLRLAGGGFSPDSMHQLVPCVELRASHLCRRFGRRRHTHGVCFLLAKCALDATFNQLAKRCRGERIDSLDLKAGLINVLTPLQLRPAKPPQKLDLFALPGEGDRTVFAFREESGMRQAYAADRRVDDLSSLAAYDRSDRLIQC